jgi:alkylglycerol monooxygenase
VFSSPSNHRVHHAINAEYLDRNYGALLVVWDKLFGTFAEERAACIYGTLKPLDSWNPLRALLASYISLAGIAWHTRRWSDKLLVWFKAPGWQPADIAEMFPVQLPVADSAECYDPPLTHVQQWTAIAQLVLWLAAILVFLWQANASSFRVNATMLGLTIAGLWLTGAVLESTVRVRWTWCVQAILLSLVATCVTG